MNELGEGLRCRVVVVDAGCVVVVEIRGEERMPRTAAGVVAWSRGWRREGGRETVAADGEDWEGSRRPGVL